MKSFKVQRSLWIFSSICFLLSIFLFASDGRDFDASYVLLGIAAIASLINARNAHKKIRGK